MLVTVVLKRRLVVLRQEDVRISVESCDRFHLSLRRARLRFDRGLVWRATELIGCIERVDQDRHVPVSLKPIPVGLSEEEGGTDPT